MKAYTARYVPIPSGYMGQLIEWPEVVTEARTVEECKELLQDALREMIAAYRKEGLELPASGGLLQPILVEA